MDQSIDNLTTCCKALMFFTFLRKRHLDPQLLQHLVFVIHLFMDIHINTHLSIHKTTLIHTYICIHTMYILIYTCINILKIYNIYIYANIHIWYTLYFIYIYTKHKHRIYTYRHIICIHTYTITIRLSACPIKSVILLNTLFIDVKILFKKITLFCRKIHSTKLKLCSNNSKNNKIINKNKISKLFCNFIPKSCKVMCILLRLIRTIAKNQQKWDF